MKKIPIFPKKKLNNKRLVISDESAIRCTTFRKLQDIIDNGEKEAVLGIPSHQYKKGYRGWAKVVVMDSVAKKLSGVLPLKNQKELDELKEEIEIVQFGEVINWQRRKKITPKEPDISDLPITETSEPFDLKILKKARVVVKKSNCWLDPAGCVFTRDEKVLIESTSTSYNDSRCKEIPIKFENIELMPGERMNFGDALHAERVGVAKAAKSGINLNGSTAYITKFPCRSCSKELIAAGVKVVVYEKGSYGLLDAELLIKNGVQLKRVTIK